MHTQISRRHLLRNAMAGTAAVGLSPWINSAWANPKITQLGNAPTLSGTEIDLVVDETLVNMSGKDRMAVTINGSLPAPTLRFREGDTVTIRVTNRLKQDTSVHWHGIILPFNMDGVPGVSFPGIKPGETFTYKFTLEQSGTYWYHSHSGMQEQQGMYGALIVEPAMPEPIKFDREHVIMLSDWTDENPHRIVEKLKIKGHYYNRNEPTVFDFFKDVKELGFGGAMQKREMWNQMRMSPTDLADVSGYTYQYLTNGTPQKANWTGLFKAGEILRLRYINSAALSFFDVRIPGLKMTVVQADGQNVEPVEVDEFRFGPGETYDVLVTPEKEAYTLFAQSIDRSGFARGTLATQMGMRADVPEMDPVQWLETQDMMGAMNHGDHAGHDMGSDTMDHSGHDMATDTQTDHSTHGAHDAHAGHTMDENPLAKPSQQVRHSKHEYGASVDMRVDTPKTNLDDPGIGLRNNGRRVLTYADLRTLGGPLDPRQPEREIELHLTGNMHRYVWSIDGVEYGKSEPIPFQFGERLRVILHNDTMMTHPMHLHGMWSELESPDGEFLVRKHTISVQPAQRVSFLVTADALGRWVWHCHIMYHMDTGMFREVVVS